MMFVIALALLSGVVRSHDIECDCSSAPSSPVCGADGHTYDNACLARCEGMWSCAGSCPQACAENPPAGWDYFSCSNLPHFWEDIADDYHVDTCRIGFNITEGQWYIDDEPACVAWGEYSESCNDDYFCSGVDGTTVGYSFEQMETLATIIAAGNQEHGLCPVCPLTMPGHVDICHDGVLHSIPIYDQLPSDFGTPGSLAFQGRGTWLACDCTEVHIGRSLPAGSYWYNLAESYGLDGDLVSHYNDVWYYNGKYSCVAMGQHANSCDNTVFHCSGSNGDHFGYAGQQMAALKSSSHLQSGAHADCPLP